jgi:UDP-N-acetylglucosamine 1-carboxyvinyltransferase
MNLKSPDPLLTAAPWWRVDSGERLTIWGGRPLNGSYKISGAKNAVLPLMVAGLLTPHLVTLRNVPASLDVAVLAALLRRLGVELHWSETASGLVLTMCADAVQPRQIDAELVTRMRASILLLGALLARCGEARLPLPGGDAIGLRGIDFHLAGLRAMGATIELADGAVKATAPRGLRGTEFVFPRVSVGATENLLIAAALAEGRTVLRNAAREPEIANLADCLSAMGVLIAGAGSDTIVIEGGMPLMGAVQRVMPDRIEIGTIACAAAMTDGEIVIRGANRTLLGAAAPALESAGIRLIDHEDSLIARRAPGGLVGIDVVTQPYPGYATDLQAPTMAMLTLAQGASRITETIFDQRFRHVDELRRMGANIVVHGPTAVIRGVPKLGGAEVVGSDVRAAAALLIAGLSAEGETRLTGLDHLDRGYDAIVQKLMACGGRMVRA